MHPNQRKALKPLIEDQLRKGVITPSKSATTSPALLVPKPGGRWRFVVDYTELNKITESDAYSIPRMEEYFTSMGGNKYFSTFDLADAFWNLPLAEDCQELTAFQCPEGMFHYLRLPQGLKQGPAIFSRFIDRVFSSLKWEVCVTYVDDCVCYSRTIGEHMTALENIFTRVRKYGLFFSPQKCKIMTKELKFLGHIISEEGVGLDPDKAKAVLDMPRPTTRKQLRSTLGMFSYFRKYIASFSRIVSPLQIQLRGGTKDDKNFAKGKVDWDNKEAKEAWNYMTKALTSAPILMHPDWNSPFIVYVDACKHGLGATLAQKQPDGTENIVMYASKSLTEIEQKYHVWELEAYAAVWAVTRVFKQYLLPPYGRKFTIYTDNTAVASVFDPAKTNGFTSRVAHWKLRLSEYDYVVKHYPGVANVVADNLSRCHLVSTCPYGETLEKPLYKVREQTVPTNPLRVQFPPLKVHFPPKDEKAESLEEFVEQQRGDPMCKKLRQLVENPPQGRTKFPFEVDTVTGALYHVATKLAADKKDRALRRLVVPTSLKRQIINQAHGMHHAGGKRTLRLIACRYQWDKMNEEITRWCGSCLVCRKRKTSRPWGDGVPKTMSCTRPLQRVAMDLVGRYCESEGNRYVLTMIDVFTRFTVTVPITDKQPRTIAQAIFKHLICVFGVPESILTDQGREFVNAGLASMCRTFGIRKIMCSPNSNSKGNGHIERYHRWLNSSMYALQIQHGPLWSRYVCAVTFAYNSVANESTGFSPHRLMFGRQPVLPDDVCYGFTERSENEIQENYHIRAGREMREAYDHVRNHQLNAAERNRATRELGNEQPMYAVGDAVLLFQPGLPAYTIEDGVTSIVAGSPKRWTPVWSGPHTVTAKTGANNYDVCHGKAGTIFKNQNVNSMFPWNPWSTDVSSTSEEHDLLVPWTFGGLPELGSFVAVGIGDSFEVGKVTVAPANTNERMRFHWWSNAKNDHKKPIRPGWYSPASPTEAESGVYYRAERRRPTDLPWTDAVTKSVTNSTDLMLNGFALTAAGKIPANVQWAAKHSREMYYNEEANGRAADDEGISEEPASMFREDYNAEAEEASGSDSA